MKYLILFLLFTIPAMADTCTQNVAGDRTCCDNNVCYTYDSPETAQKKVTEQTILDAKNKITQQQEQLIQDQIRAIAIQNLKEQGLLTDDQVNVEQAKLSTLSTAQAIKNIRIEK